MCVQFYSAPARPPTRSQTTAGDEICFLADMMNNIRRNLILYFYVFPFVFVILIGRVYTLEMISDQTMNAKGGDIGDKT